MKKMITVLAALLTLACALPARATDKQLATINDIKKSREYLYGEATMPTLEEATSLAYELLQKEVFDWATDRVSRPIENFSVKEVNKLADTIVTRRADMYRVFAYIKKVKLNTMFYENGIAYLDSLDFGKVENQEVLVIEHPQNTVKTDSLASDAVLKQIHSKMFPAKPAEGSTPQSSTNTPQSSPNIQHPSPNTQHPSVIDRIRKARNFFDLKNILPQLKQEGLISNYGKLATAEHLEDCHLIIYDAAGNIKALLGKGEETRPNLNTGTDDTLDNYRGCGALWVLIK